jgi:beta-galactosidase
MPKSSSVRSVTAPLLLAAVALATLAPSARAARAEALFNDAWLFHLGDLAGYTCSSPASAAIFPHDTSSTMVHGLDDAPAGNASAAACAALCAGNCSCQMWQYCPKLLSSSVCSAAADSNACSNSSASFPIDLDGVQCNGLSGAGASSEAECAAACCGDDTCETYQWCPPGAAGCGPPGSCWIGALAGAQCQAQQGWVSRGRNVTMGSVCQLGLLADYGPGTWQTSGVGAWTGAARLAPPAPPAQATGPAAAGFDDSAFERVTLPFDYLARVAPTDVNATYHQNEHGSIPFSNAWYRKHFTVPAGTTLARLIFDGAYRSASVFLNGALAAQHEEGYTGFSVWLHNVSGAPLLVGGGDNVVAVYLASTIYTYELWGYEGEGIERDVSLVLHDTAQSIAPNGVAAVSIVSGAVDAPGGACGPQSAPALVSPSIDVANSAGAAVSVLLTATIVAPGGAVVGTSSVGAALAAGGWARLAPPPIALTTAALWSPACSPDAPRRPLYTLITALTDAASGAVLDAVNTTFGVRNATFDAERGLLVNGFQHKIRGFSMHQDFAGVGTFVPPNVQKYRVQRLLDIGGNAWRTAHNPVATPLLDELDSRGVLVWSENRMLRDFDEYVADAVDHVARDRNHPSIVIWSLCNENGCGETSGWEGATNGNVQPGAALAARFMAQMKALDATRPISGNAHFTLGQNGSIMSQVDVMALTYDYGSLAKMRAGRPGVPLLNGESASCQSDRADEDASDAFGCSRDSWATADANEWDGGAFVWSGTDYRGECGGWPNTVSFYGVLDICGFDKGVASWYRVWWGAAAGWPSSATRVEAWPPWAQPRAGASASLKISAAAAAASVQLSVNGVAVGAPVSIARLGFATWTVPFSPGNYSVASFDASGAPLGSFVSRSPGPAAALRAVVDWPGSGEGGALLAGRRDAALVAIAVVDADGTVVRGARANCTFTLSGPGELLGLGNGDHAGHLPAQGLSWVPTYDGLARAVLRGAAAATGAPLQLTVSSDGLASAVVSIDVV